jgi:transcription elongation GreA/GreB family factor
MVAIDKAGALETLRLRVADKLAGLTGSQKAVQAGAVHEETRAEDPKDTRAIEAQYLARGLAERAETLRAELAQLDAFDPPPATENATIAVGALVTLENEEGEATCYLIAPTGGGQRLELDGQALQVITPRSPLARQLIGRSVHDELRVERPRGSFDATIVEVG